MRRFALLSLLSAVGTLACGRERGPEAKATMAPPPALTVADTGATLNPPAELDMEQQHHSMLMIQRGYDALMLALTNDDKAGARKHVNAMLPYVDRIPRFMIHKPDVAPDSLPLFARKLKGQLLRVDQLVQADSTSEAKDLTVHTMLTCGQCHEMYQAPHPG